MNAVTEQAEFATAPIAQEALPTAPGTPFAGGFYAGLIRKDDQVRAIIVPPKNGGEHPATKWNNANQKIIVGALSLHDGMANTIAMAEGGSRLAKWALGLRIGGCDDWHIPAQDELEIVYRNLKPGSADNYLWGRSGINVSAVLPTYPYTAKWPAQTAAAAFQTGGAEAFDEVWHWTSTQYAGNAGCAWVQCFSGGYQINGRKSLQCRARAVRSVLVIQ